MQELKFQSMPNFRRLYPTEEDDNNRTPIGKVYRTSRPDFLTSEEAEVVRDKLGIKSIIDFRSSNEYTNIANGSKVLDTDYKVYKIKIPFLNFNQKPLKAVAAKHLPRKRFRKSDENCSRRHFLIDFFKLNYIWLIYSRAPLITKVFSLVYLIYDAIFRTGFRYFVRPFAKAVLNPRGILGQYKDIIEQSQNGICAALKLLSDQENIPAMINCAHGKDRTGIVAALLLAIMGKSKEYIAYEYSLSTEGLKPMYERAYSEIVDRFHMSETFVTAEAETMYGLLTYIDNEYGSVENYLTYIGFDKNDQAQLRRVLSESDADSETI
ncbi:unnamed protein product [Owenia fusiformis]|uniref:Uncharacterized protein n=1 Tax=Owenia fusiformis TaxID=6347 RepID=A0A8J1UC78_OWEFU|nr:unnamed protein product [Owenia fusiformis]